MIRSNSLSQVSLYPLCLTHFDFLLHHYSETTTRNDADSKRTTLENNVELGEKAQFLEWIEKCRIVTESSIDERYSRRLKDNYEPRFSAETSDNKRCALSQLCPQANEYSAYLSFVIVSCIRLHICGIHT